MRLVIVLLLSSLSFAQGRGGNSGIGGKAGFGGGAASIVPSFANASAGNCHQGSTSASLTCTISVVVNQELLFVGNEAAGTVVPTITGTVAICDGTWTSSTISVNSFWTHSRATGTGTCTVTAAVSPNAAQSLYGIAISNTSGIDVFAPASSMTSNGFKSAGSCPSTNTFTFPGVTTTVGNDLVVSFTYDNDNDSGVFSLCDGTWTASVAGGGGTAPTAGFEYKSIAATGAVTPGTMALSTGATTQVVTVAYKP